MSLEDLFLPSARARQLLHDLDRVGDHLICKETRLQAERGIIDADTASDFRVTTYDVARASSRELAYTGTILGHPAIG